MKNIPNSVCIFCSQVLIILNYIKNYLPIKPVLSYLLTKKWNSKPIKKPNQSGYSLIFPYRNKRKLLKSTLKHSTTIKRTGSIPKRKNISYFKILKKYFDCLYFNHETIPFTNFDLKYPPDVLALMPFHVTNPYSSVLKCYKAFSRIFFFGFNCGKTGPPLNTY